MCVFIKNSKNDNNNATITRRSVSKRSSGYYDLKRPNKLNLHIYDSHLLHITYVLHMFLYIYRLLVGYGNMCTISGAEEYCATSGAQY